MSDKRTSSGGQGQAPGYAQDGYQPGGLGRGHQPVDMPPKPGAGHQPTGTGTPQIPTTGTGVKPAPPLKK
jgi:hypothetical protein